MCNCPTPTCPVRETIGFFTTQLQSFCVKFLSLIYYILHLPPPLAVKPFYKKRRMFCNIRQNLAYFCGFWGEKSVGGGDCRYPVVCVIQYVDSMEHLWLPHIATLDTLVLSKPTFDNSRITIFPRAKRRCLQSTCIYAPCGRRCDSRKPRRARGKLCTIDKNHVDNQRQSQANFINSSTLFNGRNTADMYLPRVPSTSFWEASGKSMLFSRA